MNGGELAVLVTLATPVLLIFALLARDGWRHRQERRGRRRPTRPGRHRLRASRAEATSGSPPPAAPAAAEPAPADEPTEPLPLVLPQRVRPYVEHPYPVRRSPTSQPPPTDLMARVLAGLRNLPDEPQE